MKQKIIRTIMRPLLIVGVVLGLLKVAEAMAGNIDPSNNYAWGTNVGWLNFNSADSGGVTVYPDHLEGDVWAENVGWIRMGTHTDGGTHTYANTDSSNYGVNREADGSLSGYAWGTNVGWIKFDPDDGDPNNGGVSIDPQTGSFSGYAWAENVGWINFENTGANAYHVVVLVPDLVITKSVNPATAQPGETITYTLTFSNAGSGTASGVVISDLLPAAISNTSVISSGVSITQTSPSYLWEVEDLSASQGGVITITGVISDELTGDISIINTATITTSGLESEVDNNNSQASFTVTVPRVEFESNSYNVAEDGSTATISVTLDSANPYADVKVTAATADGSATAGSDYTSTTTEVTIPAGQTSITFDVLITDDMLDESDETIQLSLTNPVGGALGSTDSATLTITDDDTAGVTLSPTTVTATEGGANGSYTIVLTSEPTDTVTIEVNPDSQTSVSPTSLTFSTDNWDSAQTVTVSAIDDDIAEGAHLGTISHTATSDDSDYDGLTVDSVTANITDNDSAGVSVSPTTVSVTEGGATSSYQVVLTTQPTAEVTVNVSPDSQTSVSPTSLTFSTDNWDIAQTVTVTAVDDDIAEGAHLGTISHTATSDDSDYDGLTVDSVTANITDNDSAGVSVSPTTVSVTEGGATSSYQVVLTTQPTAEVTVNVSPDSQTSVSPTSLTFSTDNWDSAQTVTVTAVDDDIAEGAHLGTISHTATSDDSDYDGLTVDSVTANITDNDSVEIEVELEQPEITLDTNSEMSQSLTLSNTSDMPLNWEAFTEEGAARLVLGGTCSGNNNEAEWINLNPTSGTIPTGGSQQTEITVDTTGLEAGNYQANICISASEIDTLISIPVSLTVTEPTAVEMATLNANKHNNLPPLGLLAGMLLLVAGGYVAFSRRR